MALSLLAIWFLISETHRGQQWTPALTLPQVRYGLSLLLLEVYCTPSIDYICRQLLANSMRSESRVSTTTASEDAPPQKLRREYRRCKLRREIS